MSFIKLGELTEVLGVENTASCIPSVSPEILETFKKYAANLKKVAPRAEDFLYFSAVMMHAAEASSLEDDGTPKLTAKGEPVQVGWDKTGGTFRWTTNDPSIKPYKNSNGDIFPEEELVKAHKKWVHKPLCIDHKSSSVDHTRGFIVDTYYDRKLKRVVALCALDKANYPDLARKVATSMQTAVSMGTAVGRAICTDCATVARTEADFCKHMRGRTCYGEINVDLNPLELSIVVNGADPKAHIKQVIASANTLNTYLDNKTKQLAKLADLKFTASLNVSDPQGDEGGKSGTINVEATDIEKFKNELSDAVQQLAQINASANNLEKDTNDLALNQSSGSIAMNEGEATDSTLALQTPQVARFASADEAESIAELQKVTAAIEAKLSHMKDSLDKLAKNFTNTQEENMSGQNELNKKGYFQGGGGVNEPTPGQVKYPKDGLNEQLREKEDKQMVGQSPFPGVGPVDGMHPSPESADPSDELQRKKMLARAESEERAARRNAIVDLAKAALENKKTAYFQGGGGVNEPTPGKQKYPVDKLEYTLREKEDKQMVGQKPFPGVGPVDGLHPSPSSAEPSDELKRKQMLARAQLRARFVKAANSDGSQNRAKSAWEVFLGDKLLLTASVDELSGGNTNMLYDSIATKAFGASLIEKVKTAGADGVTALFKKAQDAGAPAGGASAPPPAGDAGAPPAGGDAAPPAEDTGKSGDPKKTAVDLAEKVRDLSSDLAEAVRALTGEQAEMGGDAGGPAGGAPPGGEMGAAASLNTLRRELNGAITHAMKEAVAELNDHQQELDMIAGMYDKGAVSGPNAEFVGSIVEDALNEAKTAVADGFKLMQAFVKYANGTKAIVKRAEIEAELASLASDDDENDAKAKKDSKDSSDSSSAADGGDLMSMINDTNADLDSLKHMMGDEGEEGHEHGLGEEMVEGLGHGLMEGAEALGLAEDANGAIEVKTPQEAAMVTKENPQASVKVQASLDTKEGRAALRAKLAADALGKEEDGEIQDMSHATFSDMLNEADKHTDGQTQLDVKPTGDLGYVETLPEVNKAMMELAKAPPKVKKEAEAINRLVSEGKLNPADFEALIAEGLDKDAVAYWKKFYGQVDGGSEFASELVKEHVKAQLEEELNVYKLKIARAYELAYDMVDRGLCHHDRTSISLKVDEIMKYNDDGFDSVKKIVARHPVTNLRKQAGQMPQVGLIGSGEVNAAAQADDDWSLLSAAFAKNTKKGSF